VAERETGTVKWFNSAKGFGFIARGQGEKDIFVHHKKIRDKHELNEGDRVEFMVMLGSKGAHADDVVVLD